MPRQQAGCTGVPVPDSRPQQSSHAPHQRNKTNAGPPINERALCWQRAWAFRIMKYCHQLNLYAFFSRGDGQDPL